MNTATLTVPDLEELLDEEIPCKGISSPDIARSCTNAAMLMSNQHGCGNAFKCIACWQILYRYYILRLAKDGYLRCNGCRQKFYSVEAFSDYRPL